MKNTPKTLMFGVGAVALCLLAIFTAPEDVNDELFSDQGTEFYPEFNDPLQATALEVIGIDPQTGEMIPFNVVLKEGVWVIPSHSNYPADAKDKMAHTAVKLMGLKRDMLRSSLPADHEELGVIAPEKRMSVGSGIRLTLKDINGNKLCDYIIGKELNDKPGYRYVRIPGQAKTYAVKTSVELSTKFSEWVETGLLDMPSSKAKKIVVNDYSVTQGKLVKKAHFQLDRDSELNWSAENVPADKEIDQEKVNNVVFAISNLKLASVKRKPESLIAVLGGKSNQLLPEAQFSLQTKGFYLNKGSIIGDEGQFTVVKDNGVTYVIIFGVGFNDDSIQLGKDAGEEDKSVAGRYMFISVQYDKSVKPEPKQLTKPEEVKDPSEEQQKKYEEQLAAWEKAEADHKSWKKAHKEAQEEVQKLKKRFDEWYYVIDNESYEKIRVPFASLLKDREKKEEAEAATPSLNLPQLKQ